MLNSKLLDILKCCSTKQLTRFGEFVQSPYFNKNTELSDFYGYVRQFAPKFINKKLERQTLFAALYPGQAYNEKKLGYLMSDLVKLLEDFLAIHRFETDPSKMSYQLLRTYDEWGLEKHYNNTMREAITLQEKQPIRDSEYFYSQYKLEELNSVVFDKRRKRVYDNSLQKAIDNLDLHYLTLKLKYSCELANRKNVIATQYELRLLDEILLYLKEHPMDDVPAIAIYYQILMTLLESDDDEHFIQLKDLLNRHADKFDVNEARDMYAYAQNYCIKKINTGHLNFLNDLFELYKTVLSKKLIFINEELPHWTYKNIVSSAMRLQEYDWAEEFIEQYKHHLTPEHAETAYAYNLANLHFNRQQYDEALELLQKVEYTDYYQLNVKVLLLKIYYELDEIEPLYSLLDAFKIFLKRNKRVSEYQKNIYINLIKFVKKAIKIVPGDKRKAVELGVQIKEKKEVADINWLLEKVDEIS